MQSRLPETYAGLHVGIIMDGNGRWARARGLPRVAGHREGAKAVRRTIEAAPGAGIGTLTLYAFSADNWKRPEDEVSALMDLLRRYLRKERARCVKEGVRLSVIGRRDRLRPDLVEEIERTERITAPGSVLHLRVAIDYSSREAMLEASRWLSDQDPDGLDEESFSRALNGVIHSDPPAPDVDLVIRTSGEQRLSDFLLWECAYAELWFTDTLWPDFDEEELRRAVEEFQGRERRFGGVVEPRAAVP